ncbi:hypothetical protein BDZ90DRAFT_231362 [Jaminaea rosea]|uniref:RRM Nup35-type domain-containing protein n=1 Tax=Jaminaea rosea TaxID=1569628 RepID=A0A316USU1_9BASI|nr:hypothetical protein BDZ90DRAFT_231362 [Jaminaea rosea]PWN28369.1 hypothetical protein BDZ90DRAFT_231362 [Jaminaea rosea]
MLGGNSSSSSSSPFGYQQGGQQQQSQQPFNSGFGGQQQQQPPQGHSQGYNPYQQQQQTPAQHQPFQSFGQSQQGGFPGGQQQQGQPFQTPQQQQQQQQPWGAQSQGGAMNQGWSPAGVQQQQPYNGHDQQHGMMFSQGQQSFYGQQQQQPHQPPMQQVYLPGYLSKIRGQRPYSAASRKVSDNANSPPKQDDAALSSGSANAHATPNSRGSRDGNRRNSLDGAGGPSSPLQGFQSSFFSSPTDYAAQSRSTFDGSGSIFGVGGLRGGGNRKSVGPGASRDSASAAGTPGRERSASYMRASSIGSPQAQSTVDDDDAPPFEALADVDASREQFGAASFGDSVNAMATSPPNRQQNSSAGFGTPSYGGRNTPNFRRQEVAAQPSRMDNGRESAICTLLLYGFPSSLSHAVLSHFNGIGEITSHTSLAPAPDSSSSDGFVVSECLRITYAEPWHALRALRRSGEVVAGVAYVGVRLADDMLHQEMLLNGMSSSMFTNGSAASMIGSNTTSPPLAAATVTKPIGGPSAGSASSGAGTGAGARSARDSTPSFGRPVTMVDSPAAALRARTQGGPGGAGTSSPFSKVTGLFGGATAAPNGSNAGTPSRGGATQAGGSGPGTPGNQSGVMGRIGDAIFGW